jgi:hypothetical protein
LAETRAETYPQLKNVMISDLIDSFSEQLNDKGELLKDTPIQGQDNLTTRLWFAGKGRDDLRNEDPKNSIPNLKKQISMVNALMSHPTHDFVTLDTVTDRDFAPLLSGDWTQRLPEVVRKYKDQILEKLHLLKWNG